MFNKTGYILTSKEKAVTMVLFVAIIAGSLLEMLAVAIFSPFIDLIMDSSVKQSSNVIAFLGKIIRTNDETSFIVALAVLMIAIYIIKDVYTLVEKNYIYVFAYGIQRRLSTKLLKSYMKEPYSFHLNKNISVLQRSIQVDTERFSNGILHFLEMLAEVFVCITIFIYLFFVSKSITIMIGGLLLLCVSIFYVISKKYSLKWGREAQQHNAMLLQWMNQSIGGVKELKVLNREECFIENYDKEMKKFVRVMRFSRIIGVVPKYIIEMVSMSGMLLAVIIKLLFGKHASMSTFVPELAVFAVAAFRLLPSVGRINEHMSAFLNAIPSLDLIYNDIKEVENIPENDAVRDDSWKFNSVVKVENLSFHYEDSDVDVISNVSFDIKKGQTVAFIGSSGAGKSTMVDILLGLHKPYRGHVYADELDVFKNLPTWQKEIGYIPQSIYLSDDTIRNNIAFGIFEKDIDETALNNALEKAQLKEFTDSLPDGLDTIVGDRGVRLSGGQRQRIGIARALYHNPEILVLDEATSALDGDTETAVMEAIDNLKGQKTIIIIAHRLTTIRNADVIYEIGDGNVIVRDKAEVLA